MAASVGGGGGKREEIDTMNLNTMNRYKRDVATVGRRVGRRNLKIATIKLDSLRFAEML